METKSKIDVKAIVAASRKSMAEVRALKPEDLSHLSKEFLEKLGEDLDLLAAYAKKIRDNK